jgi:hypothetical protein
MPYNLYPYFFLCARSISLYLYMYLRTLLPFTSLSPFLFAALLQCSLPSFRHYLLLSRALPAALLLAALLRSRLSKPAIFQGPETQTSATLCRRHFQYDTRKLSGAARQSLTRSLFFLLSILCLSLSHLSHTHTLPLSTPFSLSLSLSFPLFLLV